MFYTIANYFFELTKDLNIATMSVVSALGSFFYNDFTNFFNAMGTNIAIIYPDAELYPVIAFVVRVMYGLVSFITPTSLFLIAGLSYLNISTRMVKIYLEIITSNLCDSSCYYNYYVYYIKGHCPFFVKK